MQTNPADTLSNAAKAPYFETVVRSFVSRFGEDTLDMIDRTIEELEAGGPQFALEMWRDIRLAFLRKSASQPTRRLQ